MVKARKGAFVGFLVYLVFGLYFLNSALNLVAIPENMVKLDKWIFVIGGIMIIIGGINSLRINKKKKFPEILTQK